MINTDWKSFLTEKGTLFNTQGLDSFSPNEFNKDASSSQSVLYDLSHHGLIKVHGDDAESFLQNQFTNDIRNVSETRHQTTAWCSPKGRIIATFTIFKQADSFYLSLSSDLTDHVIKKLQMYVMMSKVTLENASESIVHFGLAGQSSEELLNKAINSKDNIKAPTAPPRTATYQTLSILRMPGKAPRFEIFGNIDDAKSLWESCAKGATQTNSDYWNYLNIVSGIPQISKASSETWIPQMVNFIAVDGVDFQKGCYPGQEVVARLNYLGKTKRRLYRVQINTNQLPAINDAIQSESDNQAGKILNAAINPDGVVEALAVLKIAETEKPLMLADNHDATVTLLDLPYPVNDG